MRIRIQSFSLVSAMLLAGMSSAAMAGGFSKSTGYGNWGAATSQTGINVKSKYFDYSSKTGANATAQSLYNGKILQATGIASNNTSFHGKGKATYKQWKAAKSKVYAKGGNVMAKARSENMTTIYVGGKSYVVTREVARAMARFTPLGTSAAADYQSHVSIKGNGYIGKTSSSVAKATVRVKR